MHTFTYTHKIKIWNTPVSGWAEFLSYTGTVGHWRQLLLLHLTAWMHSSAAWTRMACNDNVSCLSFRQVESLLSKKNKNMFTYFPSRRRSWFYLTKTNNIFRDALVPSIGYWRLTLRAEVRSPSLFYFWLAPNELLGWERMRFFPHIIGWWIQLAWTNCTFKFFTVVQMVTSLSRTLNNWLTIIYYIILPG